MTDKEHIEISRKLALAIGWKPEQILMCWGTCWIADPVRQRDVEFDYRDWAVAGPIAERFDCFPDECADGMWLAFVPHGEFHRADTPQLAIALAVIAAQE